MQTAVRAAAITFMIAAVGFAARLALADPPKASQPGTLTGVPQPIATVKLKPGEVPSIVFDTPIYNFGRLVSGQEVLQDFWFTNKGTGPLEILAIRPACGCTSAGEYDHIVQPGGRGKIPIKVATGKFSGPVIKTVTVQTNVPGPDANALITIQGDLWQPISVQPDSVFLGRILESETHSAPLVQSVTIATTNNAVARLSTPRSNNPVFRAEAHEIDPAADSPSRSSPSRPSSRATITAPSKSTPASPTCAPCAFRSR